MAPIVYNKPRGWHLHIIHTESAGKKDTNHNNGLNIQPFCFLRFSSRTICRLLLKQIDVSFSIFWRWHDAHHADSYIFVQFSENTTQTQWRSLVSVHLTNGTHIMCYWTHFQPENQTNLQNSADVFAWADISVPPFFQTDFHPTWHLSGWSVYLMWCRVDTMTDRVSRFEISQVTRFTALMGL